MEKLHFGRYPVHISIPASASEIYSLYFSVAAHKNKYLQSKSLLKPFWKTRFYENNWFWKDESIIFLFHSFMLGNEEFCSIIQKIIFKAMLLENYLSRTNKFPVISNLLHWWQPITAMSGAKYYPKPLQFEEVLKLSIHCITLHTSSSPQYFYFTFKEIRPVNMHMQHLRHPVRLAKLRQYMEYSLFVKNTTRWSSSYWILQGCYSTWNKKTASAKSMCPRCTICYLKEGNTRAWKHCAEWYNFSTTIQNGFSESELHWAR